MTAAPSSRHPLVETFRTLWADVAPQIASGADPSSTLRPSLGQGGPLDASHPVPGPPDALGPLGERIGEGGMGVVHVAEQTALGRLVAVKSARADRDDARTYARLLQEAWVTGLLEHPAILPVYDIARDEQGRPHILMKRVEGEPWSVLLRDPERAASALGSHDLIEAHLRVLMQVCNALHFAHERGVLHRDLKPDNVMIGRYGEVYLLDWGLAVALDDRYPPWVPRAIDERRLCGTPRYMAPEMIAAEGTKLGVHTDVYLLGAVLYELLTERAPHQGDSIASLIEAIPDFIPVFPAEAPEPLCDLVREATALEPGARPPSAEAFRARLQAFLEQRPALRLATEADSQVRRLHEALEGGEPRAKIHARLSAARFGYRQALAAWPEHPTASARLREATLAVADWELAQGEGGAALSLLADVPDPPEDRVRAAETLVAQQASERAQLERFRVDRSERVGVRTRAFVGGILLIIWTLRPAWGWYYPPNVTWEALVAWTVFMVALVTVLGIWARDSMTKSALNRATLGGLAVVPIAHSVTDLIVWLSGGTPVEAYATRGAAWAICGLAYTAMVDWRLTPTALAFVVAAAGARMNPSGCDAWFLFANLVLLANASIMWAPPLYAALRDDD